MTPDQYKTLAAMIVGIRANVVAVAAKAFDHKWSYADDYQMYLHGRLFQCCVCGKWTPPEEQGFVGSCNSHIKKDAK